MKRDINQAIKVTDYCYVIENGRIVMEGTGADLEKDEKVREAYLGM